MRRALVPALVSIVAVALIAVISATPAAASRAAPTERSSPVRQPCDGEEQVYTVDPDGTDQQLVANDSETGQWSPDGTLISLFDQLA